MSNVFNKKTNKNKILMQNKPNIFAIEKYLKQFGMCVPLRQPFVSRNCPSQSKHEKRSRFELDETKLERGKLWTPPPPNNTRLPACFCQNFFIQSITSFLFSMKERGGGEAKRIISTCAQLAVGLRKTKQKKQMMDTIHFLRSKWF